MTRTFAHFACFDWSGQAVARPKGIALATLTADPEARPQLIGPKGGWSRQAALDWLIAHAEAGTDMLIGLDLSPTFPFVDEAAYFPGWEDTPADARALWQLVERIASSDDHLAANSFVQHPEARRYFRHGKGDVGDRFGNAGIGRLREVERVQRHKKQARSASCFNLVGAAQVGKSSLTGMRVLHRLAGRVPVWPFDPVPTSGPMIVEIYTSIAAFEAKRRGNASKIRDRAGLVAALDALDCKPPARLARYDDHATDALVTAAWLRKVHRDPELWAPAALTDTIRRTEGWTFGVK